MIFLVWTCFHRIFLIFDIVRTEIELFLTLNTITEGKLLLRNDHELLEYLDPYFAGAKVKSGKAIFEILQFFTEFWMRFVMLAYEFFLYFRVFF